MLHTPVRWGSLVAGMTTTLATLLVLGLVGTGTWPVEFEFGFTLIVILAIVKSWFFAAFIRANWYRIAPLMPRLVRFGTVGILNTLVDLGVLNLLLYLFVTGDTHAQLFPIFATLSFIVATLNSFYWNRNWTFRAGSGRISRDLSRFYLVTIVSFLVNVGISSFLVWLNPFPELQPTLWANIAKLAAVGISLLINFVGYQTLVFRSESELEETV